LIPPDPIERFRGVYALAEKIDRSILPDPSAMSLGTVDQGGQPSVRIVLLKAFDERGFVFYTNYEGRKGRQLLSNPKAALCFFWPTIELQVRVEGTVTKVSDGEADAYFATRPKGAQIGAWASKQSAPLESRLAFEKAVALYTAKYALGEVPRPPHWTGYRVVPMKIEFWHDRPFRLHDRVEFVRGEFGGAWTKTRMYP